MSSIEGPSERSDTGRARRVAILGFSIECNRFAPVTVESDFVVRTLFRGEAILSEARAPSPRMLAELPGFIADMDARGPWTALPITLAMTAPGGPVDHHFFRRLLLEFEAGLRAALPLDGVYCVLHGAGLTTQDDDPEGTILTLVRDIVGPDVPVVASFDLHANVSSVDVAMVDAFIGYRTNPHMDMRSCGAESAGILRQLMGGTRSIVTSIRLPIVPPTVSMLTGSDAPNRPYGELIDLGQKWMREVPYLGKVINVSVMGGFAFADTPFNGLTVVVTASDVAAGRELALRLADAAWMRRERFVAHLTSLETAAELARAASSGSSAPLIFADVADNPGGGGRGNTMFMLEAFLAAGVENALFGIIHDPDLAAEAHRLGQGAAFQARFNRAKASEFSRYFTADARVLALHEGPVRCRRGIFAGGAIDLGRSAALDLGGIIVVVVSIREQCADPAFFEVFGLDIAAARVVAVKSRGHFRGGFDEFFAHHQVIEVDAPGLTSPMLHNFAWKNLPRPVIPLDQGVTWVPPAG